MSSSYARDGLREPRQRFESATWKRAARAGRVELTAALHDALAPAIARAMSLGVDVVTTVVEGVGPYVRGDVDGVLAQVGRVALRAVDGFRGVPVVARTSREVEIRVARRHAGLDATPYVFVTVRAIGMPPPDRGFEVEGRLDRA